MDQFVTRKEIDELVTSITTESHISTSSSKPMPNSKPKKIIKVKKHFRLLRKGCCIRSKGYSISKSVLGEEEITKLKDELMAKPHSQGGFSVATVSKKFPVYRESPTRIYMPRCFGEKKYGLVTKMRIGQGHDSPMEFCGTLRPNQVPVVNTYLDHVRKTPIREVVGF